jgi:hypothetical protein
MNKAVKIGLISAVAIGGVALLVSILSKKNKNKKEAEAIREEQEKLAKEKDVIKQTQETANTGETQSGGYVIPAYNWLEQISNPYSQVKGRMLYPATTKDYPTAQNKATLRTSAEVNNPKGFWTDGNSDNIIKKYTSGVAIGTVIAEAYDDMIPKNRWFKVKMKTPCCGVVSNYKEGWLRADVVSFKKYKKSSSAEGDMDGMIERYDTSYQLGAQVFPHSTWENPINNMFSNAEGDNGYPQNYVERNVFLGMGGKQFEISGVLNDL